MKAVVLLSGGLDSAVCLAVAAQRKRELFALTMRYGQSNHVEVRHAEKLAKHYGADHLVFNVPLADWGGSALTVPGNAGSTYVPFRNSVFASLGVAYAESLGALEVYIGISSSNHPDCTAAWADTFQELIEEATRAPKKRKKDVIQLITPLCGKTGQATVRLALRLGVPIELTWSCFFPEIIGGRRRICGTCPTCVSRADAFRRAKVADPLEGMLQV